MSESYSSVAVESLEIRNYLSSHHHHSHAVSAPALPRPAHIVVVMEENHSYNSLFNRSQLAPGGPPPPPIPFLQSLAKEGALFTNSFAITHPSQPNYIALFSGSTQGVTSDGHVAPYSFKTPDLGGELISKRLTFGGYSEGLPRAGFTGDSSGGYTKSHNPWVDFRDVPAADNQPLTSFPTSSRYFSRLPTVSFVIPTDANNMHSGAEDTADSWLASHLGAYAKWAQTNNSLLIVTWDEDDHSQGNQIPTLIVGQGVKPGKYSEKINHYSVLRTIEDMYGLGHAGASAAATPITDVWNAA